MSDWRVWLGLIGMLISLCMSPSAWGATNGGEATWPREIDAPTATIILYQPQPQSHEGNRLSVIFATAVEPKSGADTIFGAIWLDARLQIDREERTATIIGVQVTDTRFPVEDEDGRAWLIEEVENALLTSDIPISLDRLIASLELEEGRQEAAQDLSMAPPVILFSTEPAVLLTIDGTPKLREVEDTGIERVMNTPYTVLKEGGSYFLAADETTWYRTDDLLTGTWSVTSSVPPQIDAMAPEPPPEAPEQSTQEEILEDPGPPPVIIVATEPTELIVSDGKPEFKPIEGTGLLYMSNSDSDVLMNIDSQEYYILLSGRWYRSNSMSGPWTWTSGETLPEDFASIPDDSDMATVSYAVPGTDEAREAVLDAQIPQTASVDRSNATLTVEYDGEPVFEPVEETGMTYAVNSPTPVIRVENLYYACDDGIWFVADSPQGSWRVADSVPDEIYTIPPSSPLYNVTFVRIYDEDEETVEVGYTQGYTSTYVYNTTIVYGTGYYWPGWYGWWYYPRVATWGFHVRWNPWWGWGFGFSYGWGPFHFHVGWGGWYGAGWWGPARWAGYRHGYRHGFRRGLRAGYWAGNRIGQRPGHHNNIYRNQRNQNRIRPQTSQANRQRASTVASNRPNNLYADRSGNVHRRTDDGAWQQRLGNDWAGLDASRGGQASQARTGQASASQRQSSFDRSYTSSQQNLERQYQSRNRGNYRAHSYGAMRGGMGRRR